MEKKDQTIFNQTTNKKKYNDQIKSKNIMEFQWYPIKKLQIIFYESI
jgi:hypothetical protein